MSPCHMSCQHKDDHHLHCGVEGEATETLFLAADSGRSSSLIRSSTGAYEPAPIPVAKREIRGFCKHEASVRVCG